MPLLPELRRGDPELLDPPELLEGDSLRLLAAGFLSGSRVWKGKACTFSAHCVPKPVLTSR